MAIPLSRCQLITLAAAQRELLCAVLAATVVYVGNMIFIGLLEEIPPLIMLASVIGLAVLAIVVVVVQIFAVVRISRALQENLSTAIVFGLLMLLPFLSLIILLALNGMASKRFQQAGIRVGLFGANRSDIRNYAEREATASCPACGEPIAGDAKTCPMCGAAV